MKISNYLPHPGLEIDIAIQGDIIHSLAEINRKPYDRRMWKEEVFVFKEQEPPKIWIEYYLSPLDRLKLQLYFMTKNGNQFFRSEQM